MLYDIGRGLRLGKYLSKMLLDISVDFCGTFYLALLAKKKCKFRSRRRSRSNVRRATSRANRTDDQQETDNDNSRIGMAHLRSTVNQNEVDRQRMQ
ncbi:hypothetical protein J6590_085197 [Homalodisca vitripennis]|nr:hypothetical protein J6590_085197 [Homalodisca vitripennis]